MLAPFGYTEPRKLIFSHIVEPDTPKGRLATMVKDIVENLNDTGYKKVLIDFSNSRVRDSYFSTYSFMSKGIADLNLPKTVKFAVLYEHDGEQHQFSENVAVNRGWSIRYFRKLPEAEYWLNLN